MVFVNPLITEWLIRIVLPLSLNTPQLLAPPEAETVTFVIVAEDEQFTTPAFVEPVPPVAVAVTLIIVGEEEEWL